MGTVEYDKIELTPEEIQEAILERKKKKYFHERSDADDKYLDRCNRNKQGWTRIACKCGERFGMTYDITGSAVGFKIKTENELLH